MKRERQWVMMIRERYWHSEDRWQGTIGAGEIPAYWPTIVERNTKARWRKGEDRCMLSPWCRWKTYWDAD